MAEATEAGTTSLGENVECTVKGEKLVIVVDLGHRGGLSGSGKTIRVASTNGNKPVGGTEVVLGLNAYVPAPKKR